VKFAVTFPVHDVRVPIAQRRSANHAHGARDGVAAAIEAHGFLDFHCGLRILGAGCTRGCGTTRMLTFITFLQLSQKITSN
jgi:hypothetical protein